MDNVMIRCITAGSAWEPPAVLRTSRSTTSGFVGETGGHPASQGFTAHACPVHADGAQHRHQVLDIVLDFQRVTRLVGVTVAQHVDRPGPEVLAVRRQIAHVGLGVATGTVQQHQHRLARIAGAQKAGPDSAGFEVTLLKRDALEIAPYALELGHDPSLASLIRPGENLVFVFDVLVCYYRTVMCVIYRASLSQEGLSRR